MRRTVDPRGAMRDAAAAVEGFELAEAEAILSAARAAHPRDVELFEAWVALLVDHLGDDARALSAEAPHAALSGTCRARLALAAARARRLDDARPLVAALDPGEWPDVWAAWIDALTVEGALAEATAAAGRLRAISSCPLREALARLDAATRPARERERDAERRARAERRRVLGEQVAAMLREGRWESALVSLGEAPAHGEGDGSDALVALRDAAVAQRDAALGEASARRVAETARALARGVDRRSLQSLAALSGDERARAVRGLADDLALRTLGALLDEGRARTSEALDAALALRDAEGVTDAAAGHAALRRHAAVLRRVPEGRARLDALDERIRASPRAPVPGAGPSSAAGWVEELAARGHLLAAWRSAEREGMGELVGRFGPAAAARHRITREADVDGPPEEAHAELLRCDGLVASPVDRDHAVTLSAEGPLVTARFFDVRSGRVSARATATLDAPFEPVATRWDTARLGAASRDAVLAADVADGALLSYWSLPATELLAPMPRPCADPDFAWWRGRDERGAPVAEVWDLARQARVRRFGCDGAVEVRGASEVVTLDAAEGRVHLRDGHGVVLAVMELREPAVLLDAAPLRGGRGALLVARIRGRQSDDDRRRARPPAFRLVLLRLEVGARAMPPVALRACARDDVATLATEPDVDAVWVRLGPHDLTGELLRVRASDLRVVGRRALPAGVALWPTARGAQLSFVSTARCGWQPDLRFDPPGVGEAPPLAIHQPRFSRALSCAPRPDALTWRAFAPAVAAVRRGARAAFSRSVDDALRAPATATGLARVLADCGERGEAEAITREGLRRHAAHPGLRTCAADLAWERGEAGEVRALLEDAELTGAGDAVVHARHLLGLATLELGDELGAMAAWEAGLRGPSPRPLCALAGSRDVVLASRGALGVVSAFVLAEALRCGAPAAAVAARSIAAGPCVREPW